MRYIRFSYSKDSSHAPNYNTLSLPCPILLLENPEFPLHDQIFCDDAFPMSVNLMKLYPQSNLEPQKRIFNYRF